MTKDIKNGDSNLIYSLAAPDHFPSIFTRKWSGIMRLHNLRYEQVHASSLYVTHMIIPHFQLGNES